MEQMDQKYFYALLIIPLMLALRVAAHFLDKRRIKDEVEARLGLAAKCGYSIRIEWRACPNCGKATEFA